jgi:hypothetical protein
MHAHFEIGHYDYEMRKKCVDRIAESYFCDFPEYIQLERKHDLSDAMCQLLYYLHEREQKRLYDEEQERIKENNRIFLENGGQMFINNMNRFVYRE